MAGPPPRPDLSKIDLPAFPCGFGGDRLYRKLIASDPERRLYGYIPKMASCCYAEIGALNAEGFCERVLSAGNLVVNEGNTMLGSKEVEMLSVLRILNRPFMEYSRSHCAEAAKQQFNKTVVDDPAALPPRPPPSVPQAPQALPPTRSEAGQRT